MPEFDERIAQVLDMPVPDGIVFKQVQTAPKGRYFEFSSLRWAPEMFERSAETSAPIKNVAGSPCEKCPGNPKNGGSGICNCTLGSLNITF